MYRNTYTTTPAHVHIFETCRPISANLQHCKNLSLQIGKTQAKFVMSQLNVFEVCNQSLSLCKPKHVQHMLPKVHVKFAKKRFETTCATINLVCTCASENCECPHRIMTKLAHQVLTVIVVQPAKAKFA